MKSEYERLKKRLTNKVLLDRIAEGDKLYNQKKYEEGAEYFLSIIPDVDKSYEYDICELWRKAANCYYYANRNDDAMFAYEKTLKYCTTNASIYGMLAFLYYRVDNERAIKYYSKTLELSPADQSAMSGKCLALLKSHKYNQKTLKEALEKSINQIRPFILQGAKPFTHSHKDLKNKKKLRIGYLSSDFHNHAMMQFILPLLEAHHKDKFDFILYSTARKEDFVTEKIKKLGLEFKDCRTYDNKKLAQFIYDDEVDILVDLGGLTHNRTYVLMLKPAPIQMQYLGFVNTLGMQEVDYIFADEFTIEPKMAKYYTEKPLYLDTCMNRFVFDSKKSSVPPLDELPYHTNGYITFGSFNCTSKINDYTISLWAKLLKNVENSKLLLYRTQMTESCIQRFKSKFAERGIPVDRLIFDNKPCETSHFKAYQRADIALDPTPFNGLTITLESIGMGVPVLTYAGDSMQSRGCARVNKALGLEELIAYNEEQYIQKAKALASDISKLDYYRKNLRDILENSILIKDKDGFATSVENAYEKAWEDYCKIL